MAEERFTRMLNELLAANYGAAAMGNGSTSNAREAAQLYGKKYPEFEALLRDALQALPDETDVPRERCIITHHKRTFLRHVIGALDKEKTT